MADSSVPVTAGAGTNIDTRTNAAGEHRQVMVLGEGSPTSELIASFRPDAQLRVAMDPTSLLVDTFETLDTANTWTLGGTALPTGSGGNLVVAAGTAASASSYARSQPSFIPQSPGYVQAVVLAVLEAVAVTGNKRVWGLGVPAAAPTTTTPLNNGVVFEVQDTDGALVGAVYGGGVRTQTVALARPSDGAPHRYVVYFKTSRAYFEIDGVVAGSISYPNPTVAALPLVILSVNGGAALASGAVLTSLTMSAADTTRNGTQLADGTYPWREAKIDATGALAVNLGASGGLLAQTTGSISAAGANTPGVASTTGTTGQVVAAVGTAGNVTFHLVSAGFVGTVIFEASVDAGLNYSPILATREDGSGSETGSALSIAAAFVRQYTTGIPGMTYFRIRATAVTSGTLAVVIAPGAFLIEPTPSLAASNATIGTVLARSSDQGQSGASAASGALTITLPAVAGQYHYITSIEIQRYASAALAGAATPYTVTTTNLPGSQAWSFDTAGAIGTSQVQLLSFAGNPLRSSAAGTASTIVAPASTGVVWRINVTYYTGP